MNSQPEIVISIEWVDGRVRYLNQARLPHDEVYVETTDYRILAESIKRLEIRGAPAIGVAAAFGIVLAAQSKSIQTPAELTKRCEEAAEILSRTRPTAVNLFSALERMRTVFRNSRISDLSTLRALLLEEALSIQNEDREACRRIGELGAALIVPGSIVLTHCNTGALATAGDGTALSIIVAASRQAKIVRVFVDETRPLLQGARLTMWELKKHKVEAILITDSTAGFLMQQGRIDAVIVGADRIAANGDVANKIGTYTLAVLAERHGVPFYVAAPTSTIDCNTASGKDIPIEERSSVEVTHIGGQQIAPEGIDVYAPAFDVTPNSLVTAIVTEKGVIDRPSSSKIGALFEEKTESISNIA